MKSSPGFTLIELMVVLVIIGIVAAILFPVFARARAQGNRTQCLSNLRQIGLATAIYTQDADGRFPFGGDATDLNGLGWISTPYAGIVSDMDPIQDVMAPYTASQLVWRCPSDVGYTAPTSAHDLGTVPLNASPSSYTDFGISYLYNTFLVIFHASLPTVTATDSQGLVHGPSDIPLFYDSVGTWHGGPEIGDQRYNMVFVDGHAASLNVAQTRLYVSLNIPPQ